ncbi:MAG: DUF1573 domain-containing protein [Bacteroidales bacterium]
MKRVIAIFLLSCFVLSVDAQTDKKEVPKTITGAEIKFDKLAHDFGTLNVGEVKIGVFTFTNVGKKPLILDDVISSCDCTELEWSKAPVMPGQKGTIKATYTAKNSGLISKRVTVLSNANTDRVILQLKGKVN